MLNRLVTLYQLQLIDDQLDELEELRGDLPITVNELKSRIDSIASRIEERETLKKESIEKRNLNDEEIVKLKESLKKFKAQLYSVRNNKEYDALTKEIDHTEKLIESLETENIELEDTVEKLKVEIQELEPEIIKLKTELEEKEEELKKIIKANEREEEKLRGVREDIVAKIRKPDYNTYMRIRKASRGKAVATIVRSACSGCHNVVPPQRQIEIKQMKRVYTCESCGRILVSPEVAEEAKKLLKI